MGNTKIPGPVIEPRRDNPPDPEPDSSQKKAKLNTTILSDYKITFEATVCDDTVQLPDHVQQLRRTLLSFDAIIPSSLKTSPTIDERLLATLPKADSPIYFKLPSNANVNGLDGNNDQKAQRHEDNFKQAKAITVKARKYPYRTNVNEARFQDLMLEVFKTWDEYTENVAAYPTKDRIDWLARGEQSYLFVAAYEARSRTRLSASAISKIPTQPKPDIWFAFQIDERDTEEDQLHESGLTFEGSGLSYQALLELEEKIALWSCPLMSLRYHKKDRRDDGTILLDSKLVCYPWVIVEIKKSQDPDTEFCYCQAANACSASLSMLEYLTRHRGELHKWNAVSPIVAFTLIGVEIKLWIAYTERMDVTDSWRDSWSSEHKMQCIWKGSLDQFTDNIKLYRILDTVLFWARRHFSRWVVNQVEQCQLRIRHEEARSSAKQVGSPKDSTSHAVPASLAPAIERPLPKIVSTETAADTNSNPLREDSTGYSPRPGSAKSFSTVENIPRTTITNTKGDSLGGCNSSSMSRPEMVKAVSTSDNVSMTIVADAEGIPPSVDGSRAEISQSLSTPEAANRRSHSEPEIRLKYQNEDRDQVHDELKDAASQPPALMESRNSTLPDTKSDVLHNITHNVSRNRDSISPAPSTKKSLIRVCLPPPPGKTVVDAPTRPAVLFVNKVRTNLSTTKPASKATAVPVTASCLFSMGFSGPEVSKLDSASRAAGQVGKKEPPASELFGPKKFTDYKWDLPGFNNKSNENTKKITQNGRNDQDFVSPEPSAKKEVPGSRNLDFIWDLPGFNNESHENQKGTRNLRHDGDSISPEPSAKKEAPMPGLFGFKRDLPWFNSKSNENEKKKPEKAVDVEGMFAKVLDFNEDPGSRVIPGPDKNPCEDRTQHSTPPSSDPSTASGIHHDARKDFQSTPGKTNAPMFLFGASHKKPVPSSGVAEHQTSPAPREEDPTPQASANRNERVKSDDEEENAAQDEDSSSDYKPTADEGETTTAEETEVDEEHSESEWLDTDDDEGDSASQRSLTHSQVRQKSRRSLGSGSMHRQPRLDDYTSDDEASDNHSHQCRG